MSIKREDIDRRNVDFSQVRSGRRLPLVHPGEILRDGFLTPMGMSVYALAHAIKVPRSRANDIVRGRRAISTDTAIPEHEAGNRSCQVRSNRLFWLQQTVPP
jgi:addiction module HigA family antidote